MQNFMIVFALVVLVCLVGLIAWSMVVMLTDIEDPDDQDNYPIQNPDDLAESLQYEILDEWAFARSKFGPFHSTHEGFAVLHEEFDELKAEVWKNGAKHPDRDANMRKEAIQVAAMVLRFLTDCCNKENIK